MRPTLMKQFDANRQSERWLNSATNAATESCLCLVSLARFYSKMTQYFQQLNFAEKAVNESEIVASALCSERTGLQNGVHHGHLIGHIFPRNIIGRSMVG
jgi:hypothetical protein